MIDEEGDPVHYGWALLAEGEASKDEAPGPLIEGLFRSHILRHCPPSP